MRTGLRAWLLAALLFVLLPGQAGHAHQPILEQQKTAVPNTSPFIRALRIKDPAIFSQAVYGAISAPDEVDVYKFVTRSRVTIPIEVLVPARPSNRDFSPVCEVIGPGLPEFTDDLRLKPPAGSGAWRIPAGGHDTTFFEPFSTETYWVGGSIELELEKGGTYYLAVYNPTGYTGDYVLAVGERENFTDSGLTEVVGRVVAVKFGLVGGRSIPWMDILALWVLLCGMVATLGSLMAIIFLAWLARKSPEWVGIALKTDQALTVIMWSGLFFYILGSVGLYRESRLSGVVFFQFILALVIAANGLNMHLLVRPRLRREVLVILSKEPAPPAVKRRVAVSLLVSYAAWLAQVFLLAWYLLVTR